MSRPLTIVGIIALVGLVAFVATAEQVPALTPLNELQWTDRIASTKTSEGDEAETEFRLPDGSRVDITTKTHAYEVEFCGPKHPGIILLMEDGSEATKFDYLRCLVVCKSEGIKLETWNVSRVK